MEMQTARGAKLISLVDSHSAPRRLGTSFRRTRPGPELELVESFLEAIPLEIPRGCQATVFQEPRIESGFPDLVIVVWRVAATRKWNEARALLEPQDLRVMHYLHQAGGKVADQELSECFQCLPRNLERLKSAGMVRRVGASWVARALSWSFAARKIIAIEAKIGKWAEALDQAVLNTWFASSSYILIPNSPSQQVLDVARRFGVGVCSMNGAEVEEITSPPEQLPKSYASWIFNDWAWRASL